MVDEIYNQKVSDEEKLKNELAELKQQSECKINELNKTIEKLNQNFENINNLVKKRFDDFEQFIINKQKQIHFVRFSLVLIT